MAKVVYGYWNKELYDNRGKHLFEIAPLENFKEFDEFDPGNPLRAYIGHKGFFVFEHGISILDSFRHYLSKAADESCGKCTPCRVGTQILKRKFDTLVDGEGGIEELVEIEKLCDHMKRTSLCGLGQSAPVALLYALKHFRDEFEKEIGNKAGIKKRPVYAYATTPCIEACPAKVEVPKYIDYIKDGKFAHSVGVVLKKYPWAATCGRVCVRFCELACKRTNVDEAVGIKVLKRFVADRERYVTDHWFSKDLIKNPKHKDLKVAVIGTGPAGISAAYHLLLNGYHVDVLEALPEGGGMAKVGIPNYRLPSEILDKEISIIEELGGRIRYNQRLGKDFNLKQLLNEYGYKAVFLGIGAHKGKIIGIPGEPQEIPTPILLEQGKRPEYKYAAHKTREAKKEVFGYKQGINFLLDVNNFVINQGQPLQLGEKLVVIGGGNVAMDCVRSALRMGVKDVHLVYRRTKAEMPADHEEVEAAEKEGVIFHELTHPTQLKVENGKVVGLELTKMELTEPQDGRRRGVRAVPNSEFCIECDYVVPAVGQAVDVDSLAEETVALNKWGLIDVQEETMMTNMDGIFAGGDCVTGPATLIEAMAQGEKAARCMDDYLQHGRVLFSPEDRMSKIIDGLTKKDDEQLYVPVKARRRTRVAELDPEYRKRKFDEVEKSISVEEAYGEADRCLRCYRISLVVTDR